ncbi:uncharacterized protein LOC142238921 [Haematobia irritans]|uniref:uncharacterized protein LOC142238921 n=1 Tax=Haematobia irritans TaxID=7368 RepID=UPI003F500699
MLLQQLQHLLLYILFWNIQWAIGTIHLFLPEDPDLFTSCSDKSDVLGLDSIFDMSNLNVEILEESARVEGYVTMIWDVEPTDRIEFRADLYKSARGGWQPTVFSMIQKDLCSTLFEENGFWYNSWGQFVAEEERKCINNKGITYHHVPFNVEMSVDIEGERVSGLHKAVFEFDAYDEQDNLRSAVCIEMLLDIINK